VINYIYPSQAYLSVSELYDAHMCYGPKCDRHVRTYVHTYFVRIDP